MPTPAETQPMQLPDVLRERFAALERRLWRLETAQTVAGALTGLVVTLALLWLSDRFWDTPIWLRCLLTLFGLGVAGGFASLWFRRWVWFPRNARALAVIVQHRHRPLGDRLLGAVELATEKQLPAGMSPSLCRAAIAQVTMDAARYDFQAAAEPRAARRQSLVLTAVALPLFAVWMAVPAAGWNAFQRWVLPFAAIERFTFVEVQVAQPSLMVPHGEPFEVEAAVRYRAFWKPGRVRARLDGQPELHGQVGDGNARLTVPGQTQPGTLHLRVGDSAATLEIAPVHRPALRELRAEVELPAYLQYPKQDDPLRGGTLALLEGSKAALRGEVTRPLLSATMQNGTGESTPLTISGASFETSSRDWSDTMAVSFTWQDAFGLTNRAPWTLTFNPQRDQPPRISLPGLPLDHALLETDILPIKMAAEDDFGVKEIGIHWLVASAVDASGRPIERVFNFKTSSPQHKQAAETYLLSPSLLRIPPDTLLEVRGLAWDHKPGRDPVMTEAHRIYVIGLVRHAEMVRQQLENLFARLEEVTRREETIAEKTRELTDLPEQRLGSDEAGQRAAEQAAEQERNARDLEQLAREGAQAVREAMRNPTFNEQTIRDWARTLKGMQDVARQEMQQAGQQLQSAQQQAQSQSRSQELSKALQSEQQALDKLQQLQQQVNQGLDSLQAQTLAQRLRKLGDQETRLADRLQQLVPETIGLLPDQLSEHHRQANRNIAGDQEKVREEAKTVLEEMSRFFDRTQRENYGEVATAMKDANTELELERLRGLIASNITMQTMGDLGAWSGRFKDWAKMLEPPPQEQAGGQGQPGATPQDDLLRQLMALLRMREKENTLRQQTQLLERQKDEAPDYRGSAKQLADTQRGVRQDLQRLQGENGVPQLDPPLAEARQAMEQAEAALRQPDTGAAADKAEVKAIEVLTDLVNLINEQAQQQSQSSQSAQAAAQEMEFLMQMAQQQPGEGMSMMAAATPGGNRGGEGTGQAGGPLGAGAGATGSEERGVLKGSGATRPVPAEFRDALEHYYRALEAKR